MENFEMVGKTLKGLEAVLAEELRNLGAKNVEPGRRMVSFEGDLEMLYKANLCCRTALRILKPIYKFTASSADELYEKVKEYDWSQVLGLDRTFCIDTVSNSEEFTHSHFVTYRVKDAIVDWFRDRYGRDKRPEVRLNGADVMINVHIAGDDVTLSLDSSGESLHKRGYRTEQTEAPISEVLAAGILLMSGYRGDTPLVDPMCGSGTFLIEAALIAANINPGIYRKGFAFEKWKDFDGELFDRLYNDDSQEREVKYKIYGADISPKAVEIATRNIKNAGVGRYIDLQVRPLAQWQEAPQPAGILVTNPPYGERISAPDMDALYSSIGTVLKNVFTGYHAWIIGYQEEYFHKIGLAPSEKVSLMNGGLDCELREYVIFDGNKKQFRASGGKLKREDAPERHPAGSRRPRRDDRDREGRRSSFGDDSERRPRFARTDDSPRPFPSRRRFEDGEDRPRRRFDDERPRRFEGDERPRRRFDDERPRRFEGDERPRRVESENPLAIRRNEENLKSITGKGPSLPPSKTTYSRGWKKKSE